MNDYDWYKIVNTVEFEATGLVSREVEVVLEGIGLKTILVTKGVLYSIVYEGVMLSPGLMDNNPFYFDGYGSYVTLAGDIYLGIPKS